MEEFEVVNDEILTLGEKILSNKKCNGEVVIVKELPRIEEEVLGMVNILINVVIEYNEKKN